MAERQVHLYATWAEIAFAALTALLLLFIVAPYGRHQRPGWGPTTSSRRSWVLMELPAVAVFVPLFFLGDHALEATPLVLLGLWLSHYIHRTFVFPFRLRLPDKKVPLFIVGMAILFNTLNAYVIARWVSHLGTYPDDWLADPRFLVGLALFTLGYTINRDADRTLIRLRPPGESGYKIPRGRLYELISCPNYLGEIIQWTGFAIATWSLSGWAFAIYTAANVGPRALAHHRWYQEKFDDYPRNRKALIPYVL